MNKIFTRITACCLATSIAAVGFSYRTDASNLSSLLPVAGIARALNEGKSATAVKADKIKVSVPGNQLTSISAGSIPEASEDEEENTDSIVKEPETKDSTIKDATSNDDPAIITVGAGSVTTTETAESEVSEIGRAHV